MVPSVNCSALAFVLMFALVADIGPIHMTTITYVNLDRRAAAPVDAALGPIESLPAPNP